MQDKEIITELQLTIIILLETSFTMTIGLAAEERNGNDIKTI